MATQEQKWLPGAMTEEGGTTCEGPDDAVVNFSDHGHPGKGEDNEGGGLQAIGINQRMTTGGGVQVLIFWAPDTGCGRQ